ncbi:hypothetical protein HNE05_03805 [Aquipseudomonas campi]|uniref:VCBS repeat-containing protein n=1 Tax=Aquipseudomonas campi TaxID=2731681 RepID=A0A6M8FEV2_9GAMM|nr:hypothetical protein [Pseudomonas campi]QKE62519.1 hypothetical protein HNE05_03805 [Pseudomonas campi]
MRTPLIAVTLLICASSGAQATEKIWPLLLPGQYHVDEAPTQPGHGWLALTARNAVWHLEPTHLQANRVYDPVLDPDEQSKTGIELTSADSTAIAYLRLPGLVPGQLTTARLLRGELEQPITDESPSPRLLFGGREYDFVRAGETISLRSGTQSSVLEGLVAGDVNSDNGVSLRWAGDLDGDGELDLLMSYTRYNQSGACLFLTQGTPDKVLIRPTACHGGVGC